MRRRTSDRRGGSFRVDILLSADMRMLSSAGHAQRQPIHLILDNAERLLADARLLFDHRRYASAFCGRFWAWRRLATAAQGMGRRKKPLPKPRKSMWLRAQEQAVSSLLLGEIMERRSIAAARTWHLSMWSLWRRSLTRATRAVCSRKYATVSSTS